MTHLWTDRHVGLSLAVGVAAQAGWILHFSTLSMPDQLQAWLCSLVMAVAVAQLWQSRRLMESHADMLLMMASFGGLGMLIGPRLAGITVPACHEPGLLSWASMFLGMTAGALPALRYSRCLQVARKRRTLTRVLVLDAIGMQLGMMAGHYLAIRLALSMPAAGALISHVAMVAGMLIGMRVAMHPAARATAIPSAG